MAGYSACLHKSIPQARGLAARLGRGHDFFFWHGRTLKHLAGNGYLAIK